MPLFSFAQVGIGTNDIDDSAIVELKSTTQGFLMPRMTIAQKRAISNPTDGLMVYSTNSCTIGAISIFSNGAWTMMPPCPDVDFDDDGIPNNLDIDDDNDGILDILEKSKLTENFGKTVASTFEDQFESNDFVPATGVLTDFKYSTSPSGASGTITYNNIKGVRVQSSNKRFTIKTYNTTNVNDADNPSGEYGDININIPSPSETTATNVDVTSNPLILNDVDGNFIFDLQITTENGLLTDINKIEHAITNGSQHGTSSLTEQVPGSGTFRVSINYLDDGTNDGPNLRVEAIGEYVTNYFIDIVSTTCNKGDQIQFPIARDILSPLDPDGDGTPSHLDLDSDNDGCSDAFESGSTTNTTANFNYTNTDVGTNGLSNSIETTDLQSAVNVSVIDTTNAFNSAVNTCP